jgi:hypothetical protein
MIRVWILAAALLTAAAPALAGEAPAYSGAGDRGPGGLTARDVVGKRLLDANGAPIGDIVKVTPDGREAIVRPLTGGPTLTVDMDEVSLGTGLNTAIKSGGSEADRLNRRQIGG